MKNKEEKDLLNKMQRMIGYIPVGTTDLLHILSHPDMIDLSFSYLESRKAEENHS